MVKKNGLQFSQAAYEMRTLLLP